jgi:3-hydroxyacyl-CoA dehydrogenase / 3-hydroxy-2-methylbutyryl-CoA dehydrogenase
MVSQKVGQGGVERSKQHEPLTDLSNSVAGVAGVILPMARELAPFGIRVMGIAPGGFMTPMAISTAQLGEAFIAPGMAPGFPRRAGDPSEFAFMVSHIVENPMLNGHVLRLDAAVRLY